MAWDNKLVNELKLFYAQVYLFNLDKPTVTGWEKNLILDSDEFYNSDENITCKLNVFTYRYYFFTDELYSEDEDSFYTNDYVPHISMFFFNMDYGLFMYSRLSGYSQREYRRHEDNSFLLPPIYNSGGYREFFFKIGWDIKDFFLIFKIGDNFYYEFSKKNIKYNNRLHYLTFKPRSMKGYRKRKKRGKVIHRNTKKDMEKIKLIAERMYEKYKIVRFKHSSLFKRMRTKYGFYETNPKELNVYDDLREEYQKEGVFFQPTSFLRRNFPLTRIENSWRNKVDNDNRLRRNNDELWRDEQDKRSMYFNMFKISSVDYNMRGFMSFFFNSVEVYNIFYLTHSLNLYTFYGNYFNFFRVNNLFYDFFTIFNIRTLLTKSHSRQTDTYLRNRFLVGFEYRFEKYNIENYLILKNQKLEDYCDIDDYYFNKSTIRYLSKSWFSFDMYLPFENFWRFSKIFKKIRVPLIVKKSKLLYPYNNLFFKYLRLRKKKFRRIYLKRRLRKLKYFYNISYSLIKKKNYFLLFYCFNIDFNSLVENLFNVSWIQNTSNFFKNNVINFNTFFFKFYKHNIRIVKPSPYNIITFFKNIKFLETRALKNSYAFADLTKQELFLKYLSEKYPYFKKKLERVSLKNNFKYKNIKKNLKKLVKFLTNWFDSTNVFVVDMIICEDRVLANFERQWYNFDYLNYYYFILTNNKHATFQFDIGELYYFFREQAKKIHKRKTLTLLWVPDYMLKYYISNDWALNKINYKYLFLRENLIFFFRYNLVHFVTLLFRRFFLLLNYGMLVCFFNIRKLIKLKRKKKLLFIRVFDIFFMEFIERSIDFFYNYIDFIYNFEERILLFFEHSTFIRQVYPVFINYQYFAYFLDYRSFTNHIFLDFFDLKKKNTFNLSVSDKVHIFKKEFFLKKNVLTFVNNVNLNIKLKKKNFNFLKKSTRYDIFFLNTFKFQKSVVNCVYSIDFDNLFLTKISQSINFFYNIYHGFIWGLTNMNLKNFFFFINICSDLKQKYLRMIDIHSKFSLIFFKAIEQNPRFKNFKYKKILNTFLAKRLKSKKINKISDVNSFLTLFVEYENTFAKFYL